MKTLISIIILIASTSFLSAQFIVKSSYNKYEYQGETYKKHQLGFAFQEGSESKSIYFSSLKYRKQSRKTMIGAAALFLISNLVLYSDLGDNYNGRKNKIGTFTGYFVAPVIGLLAFIDYLTYRKRFSKAIRLHRTEYYKQNGYQKDQSFMEFHISPYSMGLSLSF